MSLSVNAVYESWKRRPRAFAHADRLAQALDLNLVAEGWKPTVDNFFGRVTKARILQAVVEAKGQRAAEQIAHLRKGDMAAEAERLVGDSGWLPEPLRAPKEFAPDAQPSPASAGIQQGDTSAGDVALPLFTLPMLRTAQKRMLAAIKRPSLQTMNRRMMIQALTLVPRLRPNNRQYRISPFRCWFQRVRWQQRALFLSRMGVMATDIAELTFCLAGNAEAVCRHYLSNGRREGSYWKVGDVRNAPGRSMFVRLRGTPRGAIGKWTDAATGEHGDLLDIIRVNCGRAEFSDIIDEALSFLGHPKSGTINRPRSLLVPVNSVDLPDLHQPADATTMASSRRLFAMSQPIMGTIVEAYLRQCGITDLRDISTLRFHPHCFYRPDAEGPNEARPAMIAAVTDIDGAITGVHRTWLDPSRRCKAPIDTPRRAMGHLWGNGVRFGVASDTLAAGEGIETMLSLRCALPTLPMVAALSAAHLAAILFPARLRRLYVAQDNDPAGRGALATLIERANHAGIEAIALSPRLGDFNEDLCKRGLEALRADAQVLLVPEDARRFLE